MGPTGAAIESPMRRLFASKLKILCHCLLLDLRVYGTKAIAANSVAYCFWRGKLFLPNARINDNSHPAEIGGCRSLLPTL